MLAQSIHRIKEESRNEGKIEGKSEFLMKLLKKRFGTVPKWAQEKLNRLWR